MKNQEFQAFKFFTNGQYVNAINLYQELTEQRPTIKKYFWYLGLALLLNAQEAEAQTVWMLALLDEEETEIEQYTQELISILATEAQLQEDLDKYELSWVIRQHIREINPDDIFNLLKIVYLSIKLNRINNNDLGELGLIERLQNHNINIDTVFLMLVLKEALKQYPCLDRVLEFAEVCTPYIEETSKLIEYFHITANQAVFKGSRFDLAIKYCTLCLQIEPKNLKALTSIAEFYQELNQFDVAVEFAYQAYSLSESLPDLLCSNYVILNILLFSGGTWTEAVPFIKKYEHHLFQLIEQQLFLDRETIYSLMHCTSLLPYLRDAARQNRFLHNEIVKLCQTSIQFYAQEKYNRYSLANAQRIKTPKKKLKIGYLSHCLREHSVGWLARWLYQHHNREEFEIYTYFATYRSHIHDFLQDWYEQNSDHVRKLGRDGIEIAEQIYQDEIDILVDLDSMTSKNTCEAIALKPAPIQVTWLGWDASGIPAIDYYIADNYVLPEYAQEYYSEKIWRLPNTYLAVDGFEIGVPTLTRKDLEIPDDAVIYFSAQAGYKRNPDNVRLQMKILKQVPNSYFLIKDINKDVGVVREFFEQIAEAEGVSKERLRFLNKVPSSAIHRANLQIANIVLDTYPYNGATTTMETLWVGVPLVTKVGEQFSARNSYTMMVNAGISEGIAWSDEEYIEWGVRLGKDADLRKDIHWKLLKSRQTAPLWNGKQFTREMEQAYQQMWLKYIDS
ncbi:O-linked N-acetylglucosamine transferase family protein [Anabaena sp. WFMT]|uniref:O-linked N-acetylglucosamine transferase, SPINDLY family protein n=1 Tax=Anabaena sp. WFMT TaxID=3449730 RepID=UPI003F20261D